MPPQSVRKFPKTAGLYQLLPPIDLELVPSFCVFFGTVHTQSRAHVLYSECLYLLQGTEQAQVIMSL
jgi:hypothetical protein